MKTPFDYIDQIGFIALASKETLEPFLGRFPGIYLKELNETQTLVFRYRKKPSRLLGVGWWCLSVVLLIATGGYAWGLWDNIHDIHHV